MPTINFSLADLQHLLHKKIPLTELEDLMEYAKGEVEGYDEATDIVTVSLDDTNLPYLWSSEGLARFFSGVLGLEKGIPLLKTENHKREILVDKSVHTIRPHITGFIARGPALTDYALKQMVQLQEKFCEGYGRKRRNASIGLYSFKRITFPVHYKAVEPTSVRFVPLDFEHPIDLKEILLQHPKGKDYGHIISEHDKYPLLVDDKGNVLSLPPIINSNDLGRLEVSDTEFLFECTGMDIEAVNLGTAIFSYALAQRGYTIESMTMRYPKTQTLTPDLSVETMHVTRSMIKDLLGLDLNESEIKKQLEKARFGYDSGEVSIPPFRKDILHPFDIIEDVGIMYGYQNIESQPMLTFTTGGLMPVTSFIEKLRLLVIGFEYQEVFSAVLSNKKLLYETARFPDPGTVEIDNYMSETYSIVRSTLMPILLDLISKNKHEPYPQKIFEEGLVSRRHGEAVIDYNLLTLASTHAHANFTEIKQTVNAIIGSLGLTATYTELENPLFVSGRAANVLVNGVNVGILGEVHPQVLNNFGLELPVGMAELNATSLFELKRK